MNAVTRLLRKARATAQRPLDVLGIGECSADLVLKLPTGVSLSQALPDKLSATEFLQLGGGQIATAMVAAQRLGFRPSPALRGPRPARRGTPPALRGPRPALRATPT